MLAIQPIGRRLLLAGLALWQAGAWFHRPLHGVGPVATSCRSWPPGRARAAPCVVRAARCSPRPSSVDDLIRERSEKRGVGCDPRLKWSDLPE
jgi:hypothetical protein